MTKQEQIAVKLAEPIKVGDRVEINITYQKKIIESVKVGRKKESVIKFVETTYNDSGHVVEIIESKELGICYEISNTSRSIPSEVRLEIGEYGASYKNIFKAEWVRQSLLFCGANPFKPDIRINFISGSIDSLLFYGGYRKFGSFDEPEYKIIERSNYESEQKLVGKTYGGINFNPYIIDKDGKRQYYQRPLVWTLEQKQLLIHSIFNRIEIGKFIFRYRSWKDISREMIENGHGYDLECIDGKQRFHAILEFLQNKFPSQDGIHYRDLSPYAMGEFLRYNNLALGKLEEEATAEDILRTFLTINFTGTPMSKEHLEYVQSIRI
jgi:hypothetical protein